MGVEFSTVEQWTRLSLVHEIFNGKCVLTVAIRLTDLTEPPYSDLMREVFVEQCKRTLGPAIVVSVFFINDKGSK